MRAQLAHGPLADYERLEALLDIMHQLEIEGRRKLAEEEAERARAQKNAHDLLEELEAKLDAERLRHQDTKHVLRACREETQRLTTANHAARDQLHKELDDILKKEEDNMGTLQMEIGLCKQELQACQMEKQDLMDAINIAQAEHVQAIDAPQDQLRQIEATNRSLLKDLAAAQGRAAIQGAAQEHADAAKNYELVKEAEEKLRACTEAKAELERSLEEVRSGTALAQAEDDRIQSQMLKEREALKEDLQALRQQLAEQSPHAFLERRTSPFRRHSASRANRPCPRASSQSHPTPLGTRRTHASHRANPQEGRRARAASRYCSRGRPLAGCG